MRVLHYTQRWLELSQGFVHSVVAGSRHSGVVVSRRSPVNRGAFPYRPVWSLETFERGAGHRPRSVALEALVAAYRPEVVHVHLGYTAPDVAGLVRRRRLPLVLSFHGHDVTALPRAHPGFYDAVAPLAGLVIVPSSWLAERVVDLGFDRDRVRVLPSGVDTAFFVPTPLPGGPPVVAFVGRLVAKKGIDVLLEAWPGVRSRVADAELHVVGEGPMAGLVAAAGSGVTWTRPDHADHRRQVRDLLASATLVVTPSRTGPDGDAESLLLVNLEAAAAGRAVVTTRHGGVPEFVVENETALVVGENDSAALAEALAAVLTDPALAARLGAAGPGWASRFDVRACTAAVDDAVEALGHRRPAATRRGRQAAVRRG